MTDEGAVTDEEGDIDPDDLAAQVAERAQEQGRTVAVAESLTGGLVASALARADDASSWFRGGVVAYSSEVKHDLLAVRPGPVVSAEAAGDMATEVARLLGADVAVAVTGAGGPDPQDGQPPGTVWIATAARGDHEVSVHPDQHVFDGDPSEVCRASVIASLRAVRDLLA